LVLGGGMSCLYSWSWSALGAFCAVARTRVVQDAVTVTFGREKSNGEGDVGVIGPRVSKKMH
jgi:hypothetical protein